MFKINSKFTKNVLGIIPLRTFLINRLIKIQNYKKFSTNNTKFNKEFSEISENQESDNFCSNNNILLSDSIDSPHPDINSNNEKFNLYNIQKENNLILNNISDGSISLNNNIVNQNLNINSSIDNKFTKIDYKSLKKDIMELSKFKLCVLNTSVAVSTYAFYSGISHTMLDFLFFGGGTLFISMTTQVLNQIIEKRHDKVMKRTHNRPLPKNKLTEKQAWIISGTFWFTSTVLYSFTAPHAILFSNGILLLYILGYTPLKRVSNISMHIGALVGALPALLGGYAATGFVGLETSLFLAGYIMAWQYPHFYGILYQNKDDYKKAGFKFISVDESKNYIAYIQMLLAMIVMLYIVERLYKKKILNDYTFALFGIFYVINIVPVLQFIKNPSNYAKKIRTKSYAPFLIVLISYFYQSGIRRFELREEKEIFNLELEKNKI